MIPLIEYLHALAVAVLVGKVVFLSFVLAPILASQLDRESFGKVVRRLFPAYYALGLAAAGGGLVLVTSLGLLKGVTAALYLAGGLWLIVFASEAYCRSPLTPRSNAMRDRLKEQEEWGAVDPALQLAWTRLHRRSIFLNSLVLFAGLCLMGLAGRW